MEDEVGSSCYRALIAGFRVEGLGFRVPISLFSRGALTKIKGMGEWDRAG